MSDVLAKIDRDWVINEWLPALESGFYEQTRNVMYNMPRSRDVPSMCCLGVACDVLDPEDWWKDDFDNKVSWGEGRSESLPDFTYISCDDVSDELPAGDFADVLNFCVPWDITSAKAKAAEFMLCQASSFTDYMMTDILSTVNDHSDNYNNTIAVIKAGLNLDSD